MTGTSTPIVTRETVRNAASFPFSVRPRINARTRTAAGTPAAQVAASRQAPRRTYRWKRAAAANQQPRNGSASRAYPVAETPP